MHRIPLAHAFCNGLIKGFWALMSRSGKIPLRCGDDIILTKTQLKAIKQRVQELRATTCFTSALPDIIQYDAIHESATEVHRSRRARVIVCANVRVHVCTPVRVDPACSGTNLTMEDKLTWADTVAAYALHEVGVDERILEMWGHLHTATVYFMRYQEGQHEQEHIDAAQEALFQYSVLVQQHFGTNELMTFQLHTCMAHVAEQARHCGPTAFAAEWWLERCMQVFKRITKYRSTRHPECVGTNHFLSVQALDKTASCHPQATALMDIIDPPLGRPTRGARDDTSGDEWLSGPIEDVSDHHLTASHPCPCLHELPH